MHARFFAALEAVCSIADGIQAERIAAAIKTVGAALRRYQRYYMATLFGIRQLLRMARTIPAVAAGLKVSGWEGCYHLSPCTLPAWRRTTPVLTPVPRRYHPGVARAPTSHGGWLSG